MDADRKCFPSDRISCFLQQDFAQRAPGDQLKPFLKWAGGKSKLVDEICSRLPEGGRYVEPFLGSGAVFLGAGDGFASYELSDVNTDLIDLYGLLAREGEVFVGFVRALWGSRSETLEGYMATRAEFNALPRGDRLRAGLFVWLNKHAFNGICRYNAKGGFNVPYNNMTGVSFPGEAMLAFHARCVKTKPRFRAGDFREPLLLAGRGDVVYCDPPYLPLNAASFTAYAAGGFGAQDHRDLAHLVIRAHARGASVVVSNHDVPLARELYAGADFVPLKVRRMVAANGGKRGHADEILAVWRS